MRQQVAWHSSFRVHLLPSTPFASRHPRRLGSSPPRPDHSPERLAPARTVVLRVFLFYVPLSLLVCLSFLSGVSECLQWSIIAALSLRKFMQIPGPPPRPGVLVSQRCFLVRQRADCLSSRFCFSFEEELGPAAPGAPGAETVAPQQRQPSWQQVQRLRGGSREGVHLRVRVTPPMAPRAPGARGPAEEPHAAPPPPRCARLGAFSFAFSFFSPPPPPP